MPVRKIPKNYRHLTGLVKNSKDDRMTGFESPLERDFYYLLDFDATVESYEEQPVRIHYEQDGRKRSYTPDALVVFRSGPGGHPERPPELCEIKTREDIRQDWPDCKARYRAARRYAKKRGWRFKIVTEKEIRGPYLDNVRFLRRYRRSSPSAEDEASIVRALAELGPVSVDALLSHLTEDTWRRAELIPVIWRLVATQELHCDLSRPLTMNSLLHSSRPTIRRVK